MARVQAASRGVRRLAITALLGVAAAVTVVPLVWMVSTSFKAPDAVFTLPIRWLPDALRWSNYGEALSSRPFGRYAVNSIGVSSASVAITVLLSAAAGYSFARFHYPGRNLLFVLVLAAIVIPFEAIALPLYLQVHRWRWLNTYLGLTLRPRCRRSASSSCASTSWGSRRTSWTAPAAREHPSSASLPR